VPFTIVLVLSFWASSALCLVIPTRILAQQSCEDSDNQEKCIEKYMKKSDKAYKKQKRAQRKKDRKSGRAYRKRQRANAKSEISEINNSDMSRKDKRQARKALRKNTRTGNKNHRGSTRWSRRHAKKGDNLIKIAGIFRTTPSQLRVRNQLSGSRIYRGQKLYIP